MAYNKSPNNLDSVNNGLKRSRFRATHNILNYSSSSTDMVSKPYVLSECKCDKQYIDFCKMHAISHSECWRTKEVKCDLCSVTADVKSIQWHIMSDQHKDKHQKLMEYVFLLSIPMATPSHCEQLSALLEKHFERIAIDSHNKEQRERVVHKINQLLRKNGLNQFVVRLFGSSINGFGLKNRDINIDIVMNSSENEKQSLEPQQKNECSALILSKVSDIIAKHGNSSDLCNVRNDYNLKVPKVHFIDRKVRLECKLSITTENSWRSSKLLNQYAIIDRRVRILGTVFRDWAQSYGFNDQENDFWTAFAFPVLVIHFLQRCDPPALPCLHELFPQKPNRKKGTKAQQLKSCVTSQKHAFDDNEASEEEFDLTLLGSKWRQQNHKSVGQLWLEMLRYYTVEFDSETYVVSIRNTCVPQTRSDKKWRARKKILAIEDPCCPTLNLSLSVRNMKLYNVFVEQLRNTYVYFAIPSIKVMPTKTYSNVRHKPYFSQKDFEISVNPIDCCDSSRVDFVIEQNNEFETKPKKESDDFESYKENKRKDNNFHLRAQRLMTTYGIRMILFNEIKSSLNLIPKEHIFYSFQYNRLPFFKKPQKYCLLCRHYGHQQNSCPYERLPLLVPLPDDMDREHFNLLNDICLKLYYSLKVEKSDEDLYSLIVCDLECFMQKEMPNSKLQLFGSTKNGFGARKCDLDICLTFEDNETGEGLEWRKIIEKVEEVLRFDKMVRNVRAIKLAKVPIVKLTYLYNQTKPIDCDISLYNILALFNTRLLKTYCQIDERVPILGCIVKHFAKTCDICNAKRGYLSSYAYTLMTIHFLQQRGVIPVLQEIGLEHKFDRIIDGWNTWFFTDLNNLSKFWNTNRRGNKESIAELFVGFLRYYSEVFNYAENVVCCRQMAPLKRLEKKWTERKIAIEDPFLLSHNLGGGVNNQKAAFIKISIANARNTFGCPPRVLGLRYRDWSEYFFDKSLLTQGLPPTGRSPRNYGRFGHRQNIRHERQERPANRRQE